MCGIFVFCRGKDVWHPHIYNLNKILLQRAHKTGGVYMQDLIVVVLKTIAKFLAELPADVAEFFIEAQKSLFFGTLVSQAIIFRCW